MQDEKRVACGYCGAVFWSLSELQTHYDNMRKVAEIDGMADLDEHDGVPFTRVDGVAEPVRMDRDLALAMVVAQDDHLSIYVESVTGERRTPPELDIEHLTRDAMFGAAVGGGTHEAIVRIVVMLATLMLTVLAEVRQLRREMRGR